MAVAYGVMALAALDLVLFADVLTSSSGKVPAGWDVELHARLVDFAADNIRRGHLPLWNPHLFSGMPALGDPNAMMLYPLNVLYLVLPTAAAVTLWTVLHVLLAGATTYLWTIRQGFHPLGCLLAAAMVSLGVPFFGRIEPGHLSALASMAWAPLVLLAVDELRARVSTTWVAVGAVGVAMQLLGGHPQYLFYSLLAASLYALLGPRPAMVRALAGLAAMSAGGACLAAAQLIPLLAALDEAARGHALTFEFASQYSMPWGSLITLVAPGFFGHVGGSLYWGDGLFWEVTPFVGVVGLTMATTGAFSGDPTKRRAATVLAAAFLVLALGSNTPVFRMLYEWVPPFDRFRASGRALFCFSLFAAMLAAAGADEIIRVRRSRSTFAGVLFAVAGLAVLVGGLVWTLASGGPVETARRDFEAAMRLPAEARERRIDELAAGDATRAERMRRAAPARDAFVAARDAAEREKVTDRYAPLYTEALYVNPWQAFRGWIVRTRRFGYPLDEWADPVAGRDQAHVAAVGLWMAAATLVVAGVLVRWSRTTARAAVALSLLGIVELLGFAWSMRTSFDFGGNLGTLAAFYRERPGDYRVHHTTLADSALLLGAREVWGYDPVVSARYAQYIAFTQRIEHADPAGGDLPRLGAITRLHSSYRMLRLQYVLGESDGSVQVLVGPKDVPEPLPRLSLLRGYVVRHGVRDVLAALDARDWDPTRTVLLESEPDPPPVAIAPEGTVTLRDESTDHLTIMADLPAPAILLVTDAYSRGWHVRSLEPSDQKAYEVLPANAVLRAVPLAAGHHLIRMEYVPDGYRFGVAVSCLAIGALGVAILRAWTSRAGAR